jgi:hypothetical protein
MTLGSGNFDKEGNIWVILAPKNDLENQDFDLEKAWNFILPKEWEPCY